VHEISYFFARYLKSPSTEGNFQIELEVNITKKEGQTCKRSNNIYMLDSCGRAFEARYRNALLYKRVCYVLHLQIHHCLHSFFNNICVFLFINNLYKYNIFLNTKSFMAPNDLTEKIGHKMIEFQYCRNGKQSKNNKTWAMFQCFQSTTTELNSMVEGVLLLC